MPAFVAYCWADYDTPLWSSPNRFPGRWHRTGAGATQYWALHPLGPWAEYVRAQGVRAVGDLVGIASRTWAAAFTFEDDHIATIRFDNAEDFGLAPAALVSDDHAPCRAAGDDLRTRYRALVVPAVALPATANLVLFGPHAMAPYGMTPPDPDLDVPTAATADRAQPPATVLDVACHRGEPHAGLDHWRHTGTDLGPPNVAYPMP